MVPTSSFGQAQDALVLLCQTFDKVIGGSLNIQGIAKKTPLCAKRDQLRNSSLALPLLYSETSEDRQVGELRLERESPNNQIYVWQRYKVVRVVTQQAAEG